MFNDHEVALSATALSSPEATGHTAITTSRRHQLPADWPSPILRYLAPPQATGPNARLAAHPYVPSQASRPLLRSRQRHNGGDAAPQAA